MWNTYFAIPLADDPNAMIPQINAIVQNNTELHNGKKCRLVTVVNQWGIFESYIEN